ncbi:MAG: hypothetical protein ACOC1D_02530 [Prolixibacteraceae bacterium]
MSKKQKLFGLIGLMFTIAGFILEMFFSDFINSNNINDPGLANALPGLFFVTGFSQLLLIKPPLRPGILITAVALASVLFELRQYYSIGFFDFPDILASATGGVLSFYIWKMVEKKNA